MDRLEWQIEKCFKLEEENEKLKTMVTLSSSIDKENNRLKNTLEVMTDAYDVGVSIRDKMRKENDKLKESLDTRIAEIEVHFDFIVENDLMNKFNVWIETYNSTQTD